MDFLTREKIENWVSDFCHGDGLRHFSPGLKEYAASVLTAFYSAACEARGVAPEEIEEPDVKTALLDTVARVDVPASIKPELPALCAAFLTELQEAGRLGGGRLLAAYVGALDESFTATATGKPKPFERPGSKIGRNDPCPCGSGKKYKKCCMGE